MKIKIEHLRDPNDLENEIVPITRTKVYDQKSGLPIGAIQKVNIIFDGTDPFIPPRAKLEVINFETELDDVEVSEIEVLKYGPQYLSIDEMNKEDMIVALKWEAIERWKHYQRLRALQKEVTDLKKVIDGSNTNT